MKTHGMILLLLCLELYVCTLYGQNTGEKTLQLRAKVLFPLSGSQVDTCFYDNGRNISRFLERWQQLQADTACVIDRIVFYGYVSPEGDESFNEKLALQRAQAFVSYLNRNENFLLHPIEISSCGCDWNELRRLVKHSSMRGRDEVVSILDAGIGTDWFIYSLMTCGKGKRWEYMRTHFFPELRKATVEVRWHKKENASFTDNPDAAEVADSCLRRVAVDSLHPQPVLVAEGGGDNASRSAASSHPRFALKTNLLYLGAAVLNVEGEYYFNDHWSGCLEYQYAWWHKRPAFFYRVAAGGPEVRYWLSKKDRFHGHFMGAYVGGGLYEFMFKRSFGLQGEFYIAGGLSYGYTLPVGWRLRMEFSLGVGYLMTHYRQYYYDAGCYVYQQTRKYAYVGPTKAKVSLVWPLYGNKRKRLSGR